MRVCFTLGAVLSTLQYYRLHRHNKPPKRFYYYCFTDEGSETEKASNFLKVTQPRRGRAGLTKPIHTHPHPLLASRGNWLSCISSPAIWEWDQPFCKMGQCPQCPRGSARWISTVSFAYTLIHAPLYLHACTHTGSPRLQSFIHPLTPFKLRWPWYPLPFGQWWSGGEPAARAGPA